MTYKKKLIEVALPLEAINKAAAREKSIRHGHPSTLHLWWARRPLAACRAVLFASLVDDPSNFPDRFPTERAQEKERKRLFGIIEDLVLWENTNNEKVLDTARKEILASTDGNPPPVLDPFCGGGSIPLEAQRLGLEAHASDLNPVAVLITKALIEIPPKFAGRPPVNPKGRGERLEKHEWHGAQGLAEDVRYYGQWMRDEAERRIGHLYPKVRLPKSKGGGEATVIAWLWARTVKCPNPACGAEMPLVRSFWLSKKKGKQAWVEPVIDKRAKTVNFEVRTGRGAPVDGTVGRKGARCIVCDTPVPFPHVRAEGKAGHMRVRLMAIVAQGAGGRTYGAPEDEHVAVAASAIPTWKPDFSLPHNPRDFKTPNYGMKKFSDLFTPRQLVALTTFWDLVGEARRKVLEDAIAAGLSEDDTPLDSGGTGATAYADAVATYLAMSVDRMTNTLCTIARWTASRDQTVTAFARQALPMTWDYPEVNPFAGAAGDIVVSVGSICEALEALPAKEGAPGHAVQLDATATSTGCGPVVISTDPPYYDNIGYADLSDFFYVWLRRSLGKVFPDLFSTLLVPKAQELVATPYRFEGSKEKAQIFFEGGFARAFGRLRDLQHPAYPLTVFYAFKQSEADKKAVPPGSETLREMFDRFGPCVVLIDELVAYARKVYGVDGLSAGTFEALLTFIQELTEAVKKSEASVVIATIPESDVEKGGDVGKKVCDMLENTFGRLEAVLEAGRGRRGFRGGAATAVSPGPQGGRARQGLPRLRRHVPYERSRGLPHRVPRVGLCPAPRVELPHPSGPLRQTV